MNRASAWIEASRWLRVAVQHRRSHSVGLEYYFIAAWLMVGGTSEEMPRSATP